MGALILTLTLVSQLPPPSSASSSLPNQCQSFDQGFDRSLFSDEKLLYTRTAFTGLFATVIAEPHLKKGISSSLISALLGVPIVGGVIVFGWRWASQNWSLPYPWFLAWTLDNSLVERSPLTLTTLDRIGLYPGQRVLEIGPGPGRLLIPAARRVLPEGEAVGIDIQPGMIERLKLRAKQAGVSNLTAILGNGDATQPRVAESSFDVVILSMVLGEIPDRVAALTQCYRALKPGGVLSITEILIDPHYQSRSTVQRVAESVGFRLQLLRGGWWFFTANFVKSGPSPD